MLNIQQLPRQYSALSALTQSRLDLMAFQTIDDQNERTSQELDFRLITTSKNNCSEIFISWPTPQYSLSVPLWLLASCKTR